MNVSNREIRDLAEAYLGRFRQGLQRLETASVYTSNGQLLGELALLQAELARVIELVQHLEDNLPEPA